LVVVQDKSLEEIVFVAKYKPFLKMTMEEFEENQKVTSTLMNVRMGASLITCNQPLRTSQMYTIGWRGGVLLVLEILLKYSYCYVCYLFFFSLFNLKIS